MDQELHDMLKHMISPPAVEAFERQLEREQVAHPGWTLSDVLKDVLYREAARIILAEHPEVHRR